MLQEQTLKQFYDQSISMLSIAASEAQPDNPLCPAQEMPGLLVYFGPATALNELRPRLPDSSFLFGIHEEALPCSTLGRTLTCRIGDSSGEKTALLTSVVPKKKVRIIADDDYRARFPVELESIQKAVQTAIENATSEERRGLIRLRAACCNLKKILAGPRVSPITVSPEIPVILCGAGPSLSAELETIGALQGSVVIAAVGHAVRTLDQAGIVPDLIVEGDALAGRNWPEGLRPDSLLVATAEVAPEVASRFEHILWCAGSSMPFNKWASAAGISLFQVALNKTVSVHAMDYLIRTGFRRIALIGQDYCFGPDGRLYAEPSRKNSVDRLYELPPADGSEPVLANETLKMLWTAFNSYLDAVHVVPGLSVTNCSGGAALNHTVAGSLADWGTSFGTPKPSKFHQSEALPPALAEVCPALLAELSSERNAIESLLQHFKTLNNELSRTPLRVDLLQRKKRAVETSIEEEASLRTGLGCASWLHTLFHVTDQVMKEIPGLLTADPDPQKQLQYLTRRYQMVDRLCTDLIHSIRNGGSPRRFSAFAEENLATIQRCNPALAASLRQRMDAPEPDGFDIHWFNQILPFVKRRQGDEWADLSAFTSFFTEAREVVRRFVEESGFNPRRDALTVIAPGNWVYVRELVRMFPNLNLAVIDPWPDLLAQLISGGCFLNRLPPSVCIVTSWADPLYVSRLNIWRERGLREIRFLAPHVAGMNDVQTLVRNMELLS